MPFIQMEGARFFIKLLPIVIESPRADPLNEEGGFFDFAIFAKIGQF